MRRLDVGRQTAPPQLVRRGGTDRRDHCTVKLPTNRALRKTGAKDLERGLSLKLRIERYTSNRETKDFIVREAGKLTPEVREKSGVWYRLNR